MLKIGIVGLPNVGKSTLFQALTKKQVAIADYPFTTIDPNVGVVPVPDERLEKLVDLIRPEKFFPAAIEFVDIAGLIKGAHKGEGLGNQFLSYIFGVDAILFLVKNFLQKSEKDFESPEIQLTVLKEELSKKDEEIKQRARKKSKEPEPISSLSTKPSFVVCNVNNQPSIFKCPPESIVIDAKLELEISQMNPNEVRELGITTNLPQLIRKAYQVLDLITFYTIKGGKEVRAWPIKKGWLAPKAGGIVHSDFEEKFIRAEVIPWDKLLIAGGWQPARLKGWLKIEGKNYPIQDGDVVEFKI